jgi:hypothetical protein
MRKPFSKELHDIYDGPARKVVSDWVKMKWGLDAKDNPNQYGVDLIAYRQGIAVGGLEVEVRQPGFDRLGSIHKAHRKDKLVLNNLPTLFFAITHDLSRAYWAKVDLLKNCPLIEVKNRYVSNGEMFYDCPIKLFKIAELKDLF